MNKEEENRIRATLIKRLCGREELDEKKRRSRFLKWGKMINDPHFMKDLNDKVDELVKRRKGDK
jgi:hypothetical protein